MSRLEGTIYCDGCGVEITWAPVVKPGAGPLQRFEFCCQECLQGLECHCGERMELEVDRRSSTIDLPA